MLSCQSEERQEVTVNNKKNKRTRIFPMQCTKRNPVKDYFSTGSFTAQLEVSESLGANQSRLLHREREPGAGGESKQPRAASSWAQGSLTVPVQGGQSWLGDPNQAQPGQGLDWQSCSTKSEGLSEM